MSAPIRDRGSVMRFMGRWFSESSPPMVDSKGEAAKRAERRRIVVPLFPALREVEGFLSSLQPRLSTLSSRPVRLVMTPRFSRQLTVERQSWLREKLEMWLVP